MHDPKTVAFHIRLPWRTNPTPFEPEGSRPTIATIWHVDPESDGSDDSCGWSSPHLTDQEREICREMVEWDQKFPYFFAQTQRVVNPEYPNLCSVSAGDGIALTIAAWNMFSRRLYREPLSPALLARAAELGSNPSDNFHHGFCASELRDQQRTFLFLLRSFKQARRKWWQHPRWHVRHWEVQIPFVQDIKRFLFSRCCKCGKRFKWGYYNVCSNSWHGSGPLWFRSETNVYHSECGGQVAGVPS